MKQTMNREARRRRKLERAIGKLRARPQPKRPSVPKSEKRERARIGVKQLEKLIQRPGRYGDIHPGLYLQVRSPTNASWLFRYQRDKKERWLGLGSLRRVDRERAVDLAMEADRKVNGYSEEITEADGTKIKRWVPPQDPINAKRAAGSTVRATTLKEACESWLVARLDSWRSEKSKEQAKSIFRDYVYPICGDKPVKDIELNDVLRIMQQKVPAERGLPGGMFYKARPETAERCRRRLESVITRAIVAGDRINKENPVRWEGNLKELIPPPAIVERHHNSLKFEEVPAFMAKLRTREGIAPKALEFTILCASRTGEVTGATWSEIDFERKLWTIPGQRMKRGDEHTVPLSSRAVEILKGLPREENNPFVFIGGKAGRGLSNMAMLSLVKKKMGHPDITTHGFRSSFKNWATEVSHFPDELSEAALAHLVGSAVRRAYAHGTSLEKRRALMEAWSKYCLSPPKAATADGDRVVPLRKRELSTAL